MITITKLEKDGIENFHRVSMRGQVESILNENKPNALSFEEVCNIAKDKLKLKDSRKR